MKKARPLEHGSQDLQQPDGAKAIVWSRRGRIRLAVLGSSAVLAAGAVAGCGSGTDTQAANANGPAGQGQNGQSQGGPPQPTSDQREQLKKFRDCMKKNGVDLPDIGSGGPPQGGPPAGVDPSSSKFRSAIQACAQYRPQGGPPGGGPPSGSGGTGGPPGMGGPPSGSAGGSSSQGGPPSTSQY